MHTHRYQSSRLAAFAIGALSAAVVVLLQPWFALAAVWLTDSSNNIPASSGNDWRFTSAYELNPAGWVNTGSSLPSALYVPEFAVIGSYAYIFGGYNGSAWVNTIYRASTSTPTSWTNTGSTVSVNLSTPIVIGSYVYLFGGYTGSGATNVIYRAPVSSPTTWSSTGSTIPGPLYGGRTAILGDYVYLFGGYNGSAYSNAIYRAPVSNPTSWTNTGSTLPTALYLPQLVVVGDYVYLLGGYNGSAYTNIIYRASVANPTSWTNVGTLPAVNSHALAAVIGNYVYLFGGYTGSGSNATIYRAPLSSPTSWSSTGSSVPSGIYGPEGGVVGDYVYLFGGYNTGYLNVIYRAPLLPSAPSTPTFSNVTISGMRVNWTALPSASSYKIERCAGAGCSSFAQIASGVTTAYYDDTGLSSQTSYSYRVRATGTNGDSAYSSTATQTTSTPVNCSLDGTTVADGSSATAYQSSSVSFGTSCVSETRSCTTGSLSGTYQYASCSESIPSGTAVTGYLWSDTIGWISMSGSGYGVVIDSSNHMLGYAWSDNVGWIKFGGLSSFPSGTGTTASNPTMNGNQLVGWARACAGTSTGDCTTMTSRTDGWDGWIAVSGSGYGPSLSGGSFSGYSWGDVNLGWIDWSQVSTAYQGCLSTQGYQCTPNNASGDSVHTAADCAITTDVCSSHGSGWFCSTSNGLCTAPPPPVFGTNLDGSDGTLATKPSLVRKRDTVKVIWTVEDATSCTVTGTNGDSWTATASPAGGYTSSQILQKTTYTIHCVGSGGTLDASASVTIIPEFQER